MKLFSIQGGGVKRIQSSPFKLEKDIQSLVESNTDTMFSLEFVRSEFTVESFRLDTLCYDRESNSFVIIEYKNDKKFSVIDQGYTYLSLLLNNKAEFILEYNESKDGVLKRDDIDWSQSRVLFVSPRFTEYQKHSVNFKINSALLFKSKDRYVYPWSITENFLSFLYSIITKEFDSRS